LWSRNLDTGEARRLTQFDRDTYDPSVTSRGDVLFKVQIFSDDHEPVTHPHDGPVFHPTTRPHLRGVPRLSRVGEHDLDYPDEAGSTARSCSCDER
jgi:hypothetical protein